MIDLEALFPPMPSREELFLDTCGCCYTAENPRRRLAIAQCDVHELVADEWRIEAAEEQPALPPAHAGLARSDIHDIERRFGAAPVEMQAPYLIELAKAGRVVKALLEELTRRDRIDQARRRGSYSTRGMILQRRNADSVCGDDHCTLSGGYGHAGECIPCHKGATQALAKRRARGRQKRQQKSRSTSRDIGGDRSRWTSREQLVGKSIGRWAVTGLAVRDGYVLATCQCGAAREVNASNLVSGQSKSCGCRRHAPTIRTHGQSKSPAYRAWKSMNRRCAATSGYHFERYAARGIGVCERWRDSFESFIADIGPMPSPGYSVDRIDNDRGYEPGNCRWATKSTQARNRSTSRRITCAGFTLSLSDWADAVGLPAQVIRQRVDRDGWPIERALLEPLDPQRGRFGVRDPNAELVEALAVDPDRVKKLAAAYLKRHGLAVSVAAA